MRDIQKEQFRTFLPIVIGFLLVGMVLLGKFFFEGIVYTFMLIFAILTLLFFPSILKFAGYKGKGDKVLLGVSKKPIKGIIAGLIFGVGFLLLTKVKIVGAVISMAIPTVPLSVSGQAITVIGIAPIVEELFFTMAFLSVLSLYLPFWIASLVKAGGFSFYHIYAYSVGGDIGIVAGAFIGAGIFGLASCYMAKWFGLESSSAGHFLFNGYNFNKLYPLFSVIT